MTYFIRRISDGKYSSGGKWNIYFQDIPFRYETFKGIRSSITAYIKNLVYENKLITENPYNYNNVPLRINVYEDVNNFEVLDFDYETLSVKRVFPLSEILAGVKDGN